MSNEKIKVTELAITNGNEIIVRTSECVAPIKLYRLKSAIEDWINRDLYSIVDSTVEYTANDGKVYFITRSDLDKLLKCLYPEFFNKSEVV